MDSLFESAIRRGDWACAKELKAAGLSICGDIVLCDWAHNPAALKWAGDLVAERMEQLIKDTRSKIAGSEEEGWINELIDGGA